MIWHMIDRAVRWHAGTIIPNKETDTLLEAMHTARTSIFGPMEEFYVDGESGLNNAEADRQLKRQGTITKTRAPKQHARMTERRGALLRHIILTTLGQMERE